MARGDVIIPAGQGAAAPAEAQMQQPGGGRFEAGQRPVELKISLIDDGARLRPVDPAAVNDLAVSIAEGGLAHPITVRPRGDRFELVVGAHRLAAYRQLGQTTIPAQIRALTDLEARQLEIDENLIRSGLTALDRMTFLAERIEVWAERNPDKVVLDASLPFKRRGRPPKHFAKLAKIDGYVPALMGFVDETSRDTGLAKRTVYLALQAMNALPAPVRARLQGTWMAKNDAVLRQLAGIGEAAEQAKVIDILLAGQTKNVAEARALAAGVTPRPKTASDTVQRDFEKAWKGATPGQRDALLHWLSGQPLPKGWTVTRSGEGDL